MKKYFLLGGLASVLMMGACSEAEVAEETGADTQLVDENEQLKAENEELQTQVEDLQEQLDNTSDVASEDSTDSSEGDSEDSESTGNDSSRSNPLALGETAEVSVLTYDDEGEALTGTANVTIDNVLRGQEALDALDTEGMSTPAPEEEGIEWAVFDMTYELAEFEDEDYPVNVADDVEIYLEDGSSVEQTGYTWVEGDEFPVTEIYSGGTAEGKVARMVHEGEPFLIKFDDYMEAEAFYIVE